MTELIAAVIALAVLALIFRPKVDAQFEWPPRWDLFWPTFKRHPSSPMGFSIHAPLPFMLALFGLAAWLMF